MSRFEQAREVWRRGGSDAYREAVWSLDPEEQLEVGIEAFNRRELELLASSFPDDFEQDMRPTGVPGMGVYRGPAGYLRMLREWTEAFPDARLEIRSFEQDGDLYHAVIAQYLSGGSSQVPVPFDYATVAVLDSGRPVRAAFYTDLVAARAAYDALATESRAAKR